MVETLFTEVSKFGWFLPGLLFVVIAPLLVRVTKEILKARVQLREIEARNERERLRAGRAGRVSEGNTAPQSVPASSIVYNNFDILEKYYNQTLAENRLLSRVAIGVALLGFFVILIGVGLAFAGYTSIGIVSALSGMLAEAATVLFFNQLREQARQVQDYHKKLVSTQYLMSSIALTKDLNGDRHDLEISRIINNLLFLSNELHGSKSDHLFDRVGPLLAPPAGKGLNAILKRHPLPPARSDLPNAWTDDAAVREQPTSISTVDDATTPERAAFRLGLSQNPSATGGEATQSVSIGPPRPSNETRDSRTETAAVDAEVPRAVNIQARERSLAEEATQRSSRVWKLKTSALALAGVAAIGGVPTQVEPPSDETIAASSSAGAPLMQRNAESMHVEVVNSERQLVDLTAQASLGHTPVPASAPAAFGAAQPAVGVFGATPVVALESQPQSGSTPPPSSAPPASDPASDGRPPATALNPPEGASAAAVPVETPPPPATASALPTAPNQPSSAPPASDPASDGRPPATAATELASSETCKSGRDRLARLRGNPSAEEVQHFENELSCEILRPQFLRLKESLGLARDSRHGQRIGDALAVEIDDGVMDGLV